MKCLSLIFQTCVHGLATLALHKAGGYQHHNMVACLHLNMGVPRRLSMEVCLLLSTVECPHRNMVGFQLLSTEGSRLVNMADFQPLSTEGSRLVNMADFPRRKVVACPRPQVTSTVAISRHGRIS